MLETLKPLWQWKLEYWNLQGVALGIDTLIPTKLGIIILGKIAYSTWLHTDGEAFHVLQEEDFKDSVKKNWSQAEAAWGWVM